MRSGIGAECFTHERTAAMDSFILRDLFLLRDVRLAPSIDGVLFSGSKTFCFRVWFFFGVFGRCVRLRSFGGWSFLSSMSFVCLTDMFSLWRADVSFLGAVFSLWMLGFFWRDFSLLCECSFSLSEVCSLWSVGVLTGVHCPFKSAFDADPVGCAGGDPKSMGDDLMSSSSSSSSVVTIRDHSLFVSGSSSVLTVSKLSS